MRTATVEGLGDLDSEKLKGEILNLGASIVGFADLESIVPSESRSLKIGISIGVKLLDIVIDEIKNGPTADYANHYRTVNQQLDHLAAESSNLIRSQGYRALTIPASQIVSHDRLEGRISHKMVATRAGLGWIGKSALLVTPQYGPRVRLASVLTDTPLNTSQPTSESRCGRCQLCVNKCPAKALKGANWTLDTRRQDLMEVDLCHQMTERNRKILGEAICGVCISVCPYGQSKNHRQRKQC